jgi:hypothetical protein
MIVLWRLRGLPLKSCCDRVFYCDLANRWRRRGTAWLVFLNYESFPSDSGRSQFGKLKRPKNKTVLQSDAPSRFEESTNYEESTNAPSPNLSSTIDHKERTMSAPEIQNATVQGQLPLHFSEAAQTLPQESAGFTMVSDYSDPVVDIIFIHGLGGSPVKTWCWDRDLKNFWPAWLCHDNHLCKARIHTYGYGSRIAGSSSMNIHDFAVDLLFKMKHEYIRTNEAIGNVSRLMHAG